MDMQQVQKLIIAQTGEQMSSLVVRVSISQKAEALRNISRLFQALGICKLLVQADVPVFREHLIRSGHARRYYLRKSLEESNGNDRFLGISKVQAILDVIVAGDLPLAGDIVGLSIDAWHDGWEYEDDFCYYAFIHGLVRDRTFIDSDESQLLLNQFQSALQGQPAARLRLCKALKARDGRDLRIGFEKLINEYAATIDARRARFTEYTSDAPAWPGCFVCVEALAWLVLIQMYGMALDDDYRFCPAEARGPFATPKIDDVFQQLDEALAAP
jgi:hypothetical protein